MALSLHNLSLKNKMVTIIMGTSTVVLFCAATIFLFHDVVQFRNALRQELNILAATIGQHSTAALTFADQKAATETLQALQASPDIIEAYLLKPDASIFASYFKGGQPTSPSDLLTPLQKTGHPYSAVIALHETGRYSFKGQYLDSYEPIFLNEDFIGVVAIRSNLDRLMEQMLFTCALYGGILVALAFTSYFLSATLSARISKPFQGLLTTMQQVAAKKDYTLRAEQGNSDEFGLLINQFNAMLGEIGKRDQELINTQANLTKEINDREQVEQQLVQAQKMEAIGTLAGGIAHDFNNILTAILGYAQFIKMENAGKSEAIEEDATIILDSAKRARDLVAQMLTFSRQKSHEDVPLELAPLVKESLKLLRASCPANIEISVEIIKQCTVMADPTQVYQILTNLGSNAMHALEGTTGSILFRLDRVTLSEEDVAQEPSVCPGEYAQLQVIDTGCGIAPLVKNRIFDPFFTTKEVGKGTGMGLSVVHGAVQKQKGMIRVESAVGKGSTFEVLLPILSETGIQTSQVPKSGIAKGKGHILFVDDEEYIRKVGEKILEAHGFTVTTAVDGAEAFNIFMRDPNAFQLVVTDQAMPHMTGAELAGKICSIQPDLPIIMCSGNNCLNSEEEAQKIGIKEFLLKPFDNNLAHIVAKHVSSHQRLIRDLQS